MFAELPPLDRQIDGDFTNGVVKPVFPETESIQDLQNATPIKLLPSQQDLSFLLSCLHCQGFRKSLQLKQLDPQHLPFRQFAEAFRMRNFVIQEGDFWQNKDQTSLFEKALSPLLSLFLNPKVPQNDSLPQAYYQSFLTLVASKERLVFSSSAAQPFIFELPQKIQNKASLSLAIKKQLQDANIQKIKPKFFTLKLPSDIKSFTNSRLPHHLFVKEDDKTKKTIYELRVIHLKPLMQSHFPSDFVYQKDKKTWIATLPTTGKHISYNKPFDQKLINRISLLYYERV